MPLVRRVGLTVIISACLANPIACNAVGSEAEVEMAVFQAKRGRSPEANISDVYCLLATISNENFNSSFSFKAPPATETGLIW